MLTHVLKLHFGWHLTRIKGLSSFMVASLKVKTVNFVELATAFSGSAKVDSHYRRIQRFFKEIQLQQDAIARCVVSLLPYDQFVLSMDRTNWMLGCLAINFLVLSVVHQRTAF
ncbi:IS4 family transposase, partial [Candidatus Entotheonella serta]